MTRLSKFISAFIVTVCSACAALGAWPTFPSALDCLNGTAITPPGLIFPDPSYFNARRDEMMGPDNRLLTTAPAGSIVVMGDSYTNYLSATALSPFALNIGISGNDYRALLNQMSGREAALLHRASCVVIIGAGANHIRLEMARGWTEAQMLEDADYMLGQMAGWFTGRGVMVLNSPVGTVNPPANVTNARIATVNGYIQNRFGSKPGWSVLAVPSQLLDAGGNLLAQYSTFSGVGNDNPHWNGDAWAIFLPELQAAISATCN